MKKNFKLFIILSALLLGVNNYSYSMVENNQPEEREYVKPRHVPGEILVKFKDGVDPQAVLSEINLQAEAIERIHSVQPAAAKFKKDYKLEKDSSGWYPFLGKQYKEVTDIPDEEAFKEAYKAMPETEKALYRSYKIKLPEGVSVEQAINQLKDNPNIEYAEPDYIVKAQMAPNDPYYNSSDSWGQGYYDLWGIKKIQCEKAWDISQGEGIVVAVIDTGVDYTHPDIAANIWRDANGKCGYDFVNNDADPMDDHGHGTHVAGTIAAVGNNSMGVIGVAPKAKIMAVKGLDRDGSGSISGLANCITYAADNGAKVLNNSWGAAATSQTLTDAFRDAHQKGCVAVAAAGNDYGRDVSLFTPANIYWVIAVSASDPDDEICDFSNIGEKIDVAAPGGGSTYGSDAFQPYVNILSLRAANTDMYSGSPGYIPGAFIIGNDYYRSRGTSMACPHVAGAAALVYSKYPQLTNDEVRRRIIMAADDLGRPGKDDYFGYGRLNARNALLADISIASPANEGFLHRQITIEGAASAIEGFKRYELWYTFLSDTGNQNPYKFYESTTAVQGPNGTLGIWDTAGCDDGRYLLTLKVIFNDNDEVDTSINVNVDNANQPPVFKETAGKMAVVGRDNYFKIEAVDPDDPLTPEGKITYSVYNLPDGARFYPSTRLLFWKPTHAQKGIYEVTFEARDNQNTTTNTMSLSTVVIDGTTVPLDSRLYWGSFDIYDNRIVLEAVDYDNYGTYICLYDISTGKMAKLTDNRYYRHNPRIYGDKIVWEQQRPEFGIDAYLYDLSMKKAVKLPDDLGASAIYEDKIVWDSYDNMTNYIYMYDLSTDTKTEITAGHSGQQSPEIHGDKIVWEGGTEGADTGWDIYMYDISTNVKIPVCATPEWQRRPAIYGDKVVWLDYRNDPGDIYLYDIPTGLEHRITTGNGIDAYGGLPDIYGDNIVWVGFRDNGFGEVYLYALSRKQELRITDNWTYEARPPHVYKNTIAWLHYRSPEDWPSPTHLLVAKVFFVPQIISVEPAAVFRGHLLTVEGKDFGHEKGDSKVRFANGALGTIKTWSDSRITCVVPVEAKSGPLKVITMGGASNPVNVTVSTLSKPAAPKNLTGAVISGSRIDLSWAKGPSGGPVSLFSIERKDGLNGSYKQIATVPGDQLTYSNTGLGCGTNYYYKVRAVNSTGYSGYSNILVISIPTLPAAPKNLTATAGTYYGQPLVRLKWSEPLPPGDETYIERKTGPGGTYGVIAKVSALIVLKYDDYKVTKGTKYYYRVRSHNITGYSAYSNEASVN